MSILAHRLWIIAIFIALAPAATFAAPPILSADPAPEWNAKFAGKTGWIGGDGVYSVELDKDRVLWLFGDTLIGTVNDGRRTGAVMVNNTIAIQEGQKPDASLRFVTGTGKNGKPAAVFTPADGKGWFWPQGVVRVGPRLFVFLPQIDKSGDPGVFGFRQIGQWLAVVDNPLDEPDKWRVKQVKLPGAKFATDGDRSWGSAVLADGQYIYIYGYLDNKKGMASKHLMIARVPAEKLEDFASWRYLSGNGWTEAPADAAPLAEGLAAEFSVTRLAGGKGFALVYTLNGLGDRIVGRFSDTPQGPWSAPVLLYKCPEMAADKGVFSYAAKAHAWAAGADELVVSYCANSWDFARLFKEEKVYRPKFVRVRMGVGKS